MRITLDIDDDVLKIASEMARFNGEDTGRVISTLARRGLQPEKAPALEFESGIPVWKHAPDAISVTSEMVAISPIMIEPASANP